MSTSLAEVVLVVELALGSLLEAELCQVLVHPCLSDPSLLLEGAQGAHGFSDIDLIFLSGSIHVPADVEVWLIRSPNSWDASMNSTLR